MAASEPKSAGADNLLPNRHSSSVWLPRRVSNASPILVWTVTTVTIVAALVWARTILIPLAFAIFMTFVLGPAVNRLRRWHLGRVPAVLLVVATAVMVVGTVGWLVSAQMSALVQELPDHTGKIRTKLNAARAYFETEQGGTFSKLIKELEAALLPSTAHTAESPPVRVTIESKQPMWLAYLESLVGYGMEAAGQVALSFLLVVFLLLGREDMRNRVIRLIGSHHITATTKAVDDIGTRISRYLRTQLFINAAFGLTLAIALTFANVRYAMLWGFVAGLMRYVPYVGTLIGLFPPLVAAVAMSDGWSQPFIVLAIYVTLEVVVNTAVEPQLFGRSLGISEVAQVFSAALWAFLWGPVGLVLSGPLTACLLVVGKNVPQLQFLVVLLGDDDPLPPAVAFFQRLAARDRPEAELIVREYLKDHSAEQAVDELLLPALGQMQAALTRDELSEGDADIIIQTSREIADKLIETMPQMETDGSVVRLLVAPADGPGDSLGTELLSTRLNSGQRWDAKPLTDTSLASDIVQAVQADLPPAVIIVALAPGSLMHVRYLAKRLRAIAPDVKLIVGRWGDLAAGPEQRNSLLELGITEVTTTMAETLQLLHSWRVVLLDQPATAPSESEKNLGVKVGTLAAM